MKYNYLNIYNNLIKLTRNKNLYLYLEKNDTFSDRLVFLFFHFALFLKRFKSEIPKNDLQELFDFVIRQIELSIREIGYGDVSVNKKMKDFINLFYSIVNKIEIADLNDKDEKMYFIKNYINTNNNLEFYADYLEKYRFFFVKKHFK